MKQMKKLSFIIIKFLNKSKSHKKIIIIASKKKIAILSKKVPSKNKIKRRLNKKNLH